MSADTRKTRRIVFGFVLLLFTYLVCELSALLLYAVVELKFPPVLEFQLQRLAFIATEHAEQPLKNRVLMQFKTYEIIHPYLGYIRNPSTEEGVTEFGFPDLNGIPLLGPKPDNTIVIGIFGGSFALNTSHQGADALRATLQHSPYFQDMDIIIHTLALGGYKQPQQLFTLGYLLSLGAQFDIVINLDGFNEAVLPPIENIPKQVSPFHPRNWYMRVHNLNDTETLTMIGEIAYTAKRRKTWAGIFARFPFRYSIICNIVWKYWDVHLSEYQIRKGEELQRYKTTSSDQLEYLVTGPPFNYTQESDLYEDLARFWKACSIQMFGIASANNFAYLHFLQPNQYVPNSKPLTEEEMRVAFDPESQMKHAVEQGYPFFRRYGRALLEQGIPFYDLTMIFAENDTTLYFDTCCHVNAEGSRIIGEAIGNAIIEQMYYE